MFNYGGIQFEDIRFSGEDWPTYKAGILSYRLHEYWRSKQVLRNEIISRELRLAFKHYLIKKKKTKLRY